MMTVVTMKTRLKTQGLLDPSEVCAYWSQTVVCTIELCLSVDKLVKGMNDVSVQCLCNVHSVTFWKLGTLTPLLNCTRLLKAVNCHHLSAIIVRSIRNTHVRTTISHIQIFDVKCSEVWYQPLSHILQTIVNRITSAWGGSQNRFCLFQWLLIRLHNVSNLGLKQLNEFFITLHHYRWSSSWCCSCCGDTEYAPTWSTVNFPSYSFRCRSNFCFTFAWKLQTDHLWHVKYSQCETPILFHPACHDLEKSVIYFSKMQGSIANWLCNAVFLCLRP